MSDNFEHLLSQITDSYEQDRIFLEFKDKKIEKEFLEQHTPKILSYSKLFAIELSLVFMIYTFS